MFSESWGGWSDAVAIKRFAIHCPGEDVQCTIACDRNSYAEL